MSEFDFADIDEPYREAPRQIDFRIRELESKLTEALSAALRWRRMYERSDMALATTTTELCAVRRALANECVQHSNSIAYLTARINALATGDLP